MHPWRGGLCHEALHYHTATGPGAYRHDQPQGTGGVKSSVPFPHHPHHPDPLSCAADKAAAALASLYQSGLAAVDQDSYSYAAGRLHKASSSPYSTPFGMSPQQLHTPCTGDAAACSPVPASRAASRQPSNAIDGLTINQLLLQQTLDSNSCVSLQNKLAAASRLHAPTTAAGDWSLGTAVQHEPAATPPGSELLAHLPASQHSQLLDSMLAPTHLQEQLLAAMQAGTAASPMDLLLPQYTAAATSKNGHQQLMQQLQLQASLAAAANCAAAATSEQQRAAGGSPVNGSMLQLLMQQQQQAATQQLQAMLQSNAALAAPDGTLGAACSGTAAAAAAAAAAHLWSLAAAGGFTNPAVLAQQQQAILTQAVSMIQQQQLQQSAMLGAAAAGGTQYERLAAQLLAGQMPTCCYNTPGHFSANSSSPFASFSDRGVGCRPAASGHRNGVMASGQHTAIGLGAAHSYNSGSSSATSNGRRGRTNSTRRPSSGGIGNDGVGVLGSSASGTTSRTTSVAGSDLGSSADNAAAAAGLSLSDLCPSKFQDCWGSADAGSSCGSNSSRTSSDAAAPSWLTGSSMFGSLASSPVSSRATSMDSWGSDDEEAGRCGEAVVAQLAGLAGALPGLQLLPGTLPAGGDAVRGSKRDQDAAATASPAAPIKLTSSSSVESIGGCPVWFPGAREAAGDDSWYLDLPPTCRLFVGNIGSWVDEDMLMGYFGKYGNVVDVQVMWNTKMLARGRRVNREFAFISYSTPLEAARAVHWLDGCRLVDLEKDKNGITVEYENGEGEGGAGAPCK